MSALVVAMVVASGASWLGPTPPAEVKRVVTIAPSLSETVIALGAGERLVGVSRFDELPAGMTIPRVGGFSDPSVETIVALKPDLVVVQKGPGNQRPVETLASLGISVLAVPLTTVADSLEAMTELGRALGRVEAAARLRAEVEQTRAAVRARAKARKGVKTVLFVYGFSPLVVAGPGSFAHELLLDCGAKNVAEKAPTAYPTYSLEHAVALTPELIIDAADVSTGREDVRALPQLGRARWVSVPTKDLLHPGPALAHGLLELERLLWGTADSH